MASAKLALVRSIHAAWARGDYSSADWAHPEIEFVIADWPTPGGWTGLAGMAEGFRGYLSAWQEYHVKAADYRELDDERVLVPIGFSGRGKTSGLELGQMQTKGANLFHVRGGKVTRLVLYFDRERALADLGLAPEADAARSVSAENVEAVRRIYEAWNSDDPGLELFDPSFELHQTASMLDSARVFRGHDGLLQCVQELFSGLRDLSWKPDDFIGAPDEQVVVPFRFRARGRSTGVPVDMSLVHVWTLRDDLAIRCETYEDLAKALEAVGLTQ